LSTSGPSGAALARCCLLDQIEGADEDTREDLRRIIVGIPSEADPADPAAREYRKRLATALY